MNFKERLQLSIGVAVEDVFCKVHYFTCKVKRVVRYLPVIWRDEDWEFTDFLDVLLVKLNQMQEYEAKYSFSYDAGNSIVDIQKIKDSIHRYINHYEIYEAEHGYKSIEDVIGLTRCLDIDNKTGARIVGYVHKDGTPVTEEENAKIKEYYEEMYRDREKAWKNIWSTISKKSRYWGD